VLDSLCEKTIHTHLVPGSRMRGAVPHKNIHIFETIELRTYLYWIFPTLSPLVGWAFNKKCYRTRLVKSTVSRAVVYWFHIPDAHFIVLRRSIVTCTRCEGNTFNLTRYGCYERTQTLPVTFFLVCKCSIVKLNTHLRLVPRLTCEAVPPNLHTSSLRGAWLSTGETLRLYQYTCWVST